MDNKHIILTEKEWEDFRKMLLAVQRCGLEPLTNCKLWAAIFKEYSSVVSH